jgi:hypothetical protein
MVEVLEIDSSSALMISVMRRTSACVAVTISELALSLGVMDAYESSKGCRFAINVVTFACSG